jgi:hypothetical protein
MFKKIKNTKHEIRNTKQIQNPNVQIIKTDSNAVILNERPASEESPIHKQEALLSSA